MNNVTKEKHNILLSFKLLIPTGLIEEYCNKMTEELQICKFLCNYSEQVKTVAVLTVRIDLGMQKSLCAANFNGVLHHNYEGTE